MALSRRGFLAGAAAAALAGCGGSPSPPAPRRRQAAVPAVQVSDGEAVGLDFARDGRTLYVGDGHGSLSAVDVGSRRVSRRIDGPSRVWDVAVDREGTVAWCSEGGALRTLRAGAGSPERAPGGGPGFSLAWRPPGRAPLALGRDDGTVALVGADVVLRGLLTVVLGVTWSPDGRLVAGCDYAGEGRIWDRAGRSRGVLRYADDDTGDDMNGIAWHGGHVAVASQDGGIRFWSRAGGRPVGRLEPAEDGWARALAVSPSEKVLADAGAAGSVRFTAERGTVALGGRRIADEPVWGLAFAPDGRTVAAACGDGAVRLVPTPREAWAARS